MDFPMPVDLFVTKAAEYLLVIGFLGALILFWRLLARRRAPARTPLPDGHAAATPTGWFGLALERWYHPGHGWARQTSDGLITVGADDFVQKLVGRADSLTLPETGARLEQGQPATRFAIDGRSVSLSVPIAGEVVERNPAVLARPGLVNDDPYGQGWLFKVRPSRWPEDTVSLMEKSAATAWMHATEDDLCRRMSPSFGLLLQDGGVPVDGIARVLAGDDWDELAREFLER